MNKLINMKTDKIILLLFAPWIILFLVPIIPFFNGTENTHRLLFIIFLMQIGMIFSFSYITMKSLKQKNLENVIEFNLRKLKNHTILNFCIVTSCFLPIILPEKFNVSVLILLSLYLILLFSELNRLKNISKFIVSLENNKKAEFKEYVYTFFLLTSMFGIWNIHMRIKNLINVDTTAPNRVDCPITRN